jgi:hypothetical protein
LTEGGGAVDSEQKGPTLSTGEQSRLGAKFIINRAGVASIDMKEKSAASGVAKI